MTFGHAVLSDFKRSGAAYLLNTTFGGTQENRELVGMLDWRPLNLELDPFDPDPPLARIAEGRVDWGEK